MDSVAEKKQIMSDTASSVPAASMAAPTKKKDSQCFSDDNEKMNVSLNSPKTFAWGTKTSKTQSPSPSTAEYQGKLKAKSLADIMAEESETQRVVQMAYGQDMSHLSLVEMEQEQERLWNSLQKQDDQKRLQEIEETTQTTVEHTTENNSNANLSGLNIGADGSPNNSPNPYAAIEESSEPDFLREARQYLSEQEIREIEQALRESSETGPLTTDQNKNNIDYQNPTSLAATAKEGASESFLSPEEAAAIEAAILDADARQEEESVRLALSMQQQELQQLQLQQPSHRSKQEGNVRTMTRAEVDEEYKRSATSSLFHYSTYDSSDPVAEDNVGFRMNPAAVHDQGWARARNRHTIVGPNQELRTKHDLQVQGQANAHTLGLDEDDFGLRPHVGNQAFNSFIKTMKGTTKGVASHGTGRAGTDSTGTKGKAMDAQVRLIISKAINNDMIEECHGAVKQGKEAVVYHASKGKESQGHDVAVKVFKRITEFKGRGAYVDGDPRYFGNASFGKHSDREQLELWTEKEYRNLVRANRSKVPVPTPLHYQENVLFMRFMGTDGWPAPQLRQIQMRKGSKKWDVLYTQVMEAIRRLYVDARLVHGDLSEYNILVAASFQVENKVYSNSDKEMDLQAVLIDFGQSVEVRHPESQQLLERDIDRVQTFFGKVGATTLTTEDALNFVMGGSENEISEKEESRIIQKNEESLQTGVTALATNSIHS